MDYFVFKLNIQPDILLNYKDEYSFNYLRFDLIPLALQNVLQINFNNDFYELIPEKSSSVIFDNLFEKLEHRTQKLFDNYNEIINNYKKQHNIYYSKEYLNLNEKCMNERRLIERNYPGVVKAYELFSDEVADKYAKIESNNKIGTGITHLRKFYKIKLYLETYKQDNIINSLNLIAFYNPYTEHILVKSPSETAAKNYVHSLSELINNNKSSSKHIGKININPVYESIILKGNYTEVKYIIVYPNGNPPQERDNILKESEAKEAEYRFIGTDGKPLKIDSIQNVIEKEAKKGYLKSLKVKGEKISKKIKTFAQLDKTS